MNNSYTNPSKASLDLELWRLICEVNPLEAIKHYRAVTPGVGLREAKDYIDVVRAEITAILTPKIKPDLAVAIMDLWDEEPGGWSLANVRSFLAGRGINASEREVCMAMRAQGIGDYRVRVWMKDAPIV